MQDKLDLHKKRVYSVDPPKSANDCMILTPAEAFMYNLRGIPLVDMTEKHGMTINRLKLSRKELTHGTMERTSTIA